jgi:hypothetical protein
MIHNGYRLHSHLKMRRKGLATNCHQEKQPRELATVATVATNKNKAF